MKNYQLLIIAAILVVIALVVGQDNKPGGDPLVGRSLLSPGEVDQIAAISLTAADETISLAKQGGIWRVTSKHGFAAQPDRIEDLFQKLTGARIIEMVSSNKERHIDLGVAALAEGARPADDSLLLKFTDKDERELKSLYLGKGRQSRGPDGEIGFGEDGQYLRIGNNDQVYLISSRLWIDKALLRWLNTSLLKLAASDISRITNRPVDGDGYILSRESATASLQLAELPEGQQTKASAADSISAFFANLEAGDIIATDMPLQHPDLASATLVEIETTNGLTLSLRIGSGPIDLPNVGQGHIISLDAGYTGTDSTLKALADETAANAAKFVYAMSEAKIKPLLSQPAELHEPKPEPPPATTDGDTAALSEVEAAHILIAWQGAERSAATRSQAEARQLIDELHEKIKQGTDFGELAEEHSDCPSGKSSKGSLGSFGRGSMAKPFEEAAFALKVGEVSQVVETGFGYHLIRRDK